MPTFQNTQTGRVVTLPEEPTRNPDLPGRDSQHIHFLQAYKRSKRWVRIDQPDYEPAPEPERIPPAYLDPGDGTPPYPIPPANAVALDERGRASGREAPIHPGYQAGPIHDPAAPAQGIDDRLKPHSRTHAAFDDDTARRSGEQFDVDGNRPSGEPSFDEPDPLQAPQPDIGRGADRPPEAGRGSGRERWAAYADSIAVDFDDSDTRDDIVSKVKASESSGTRTW